MDSIVMTWEQWENCQEINLGHQGEASDLQISVNLEGLNGLWYNKTVKFEYLVTRPFESKAYSVNNALNSSGYLDWKVSAKDTAIAGSGNVVIQITITDPTTGEVTIKKSSVVKTKILPSVMELMEMMDIDEEEEDMEIGTWTPTTTTSGLTFSNAKYYKIGKLVFLHFDMAGTSVTGFAVSGLPFPVSGANNTLVGTLSSIAAPGKSAQGFATSSSYLTFVSDSATIQGAPCSFTGLYLTD